MTIATGSVEVSGVEVFVEAVGASGFVDKRPPLDWVSFCASATYDLFGPSKVCFGTDSFAMNIVFARDF